MSQDDILKYLTKKKKATTEDLVNALDISWTAVTKALRKLCKQQEIDKIEIDKKMFIDLGFESKSYNGRFYLWKLKK